MAIETDPEHGGSGASFTSAILVIEELAKIDPAVSVCCDVHNTLVNTVLRKYASQTVKDKYLPQLSENKVSLLSPGEKDNVLTCREYVARFFCTIGTRFRIRRVRVENDCEEE